MLKKIRCHECSAVQSSARDVCMECGVFMKRTAEYFLEDADTAKTLPPPYERENINLHQEKPPAVKINVMTAGRSAATAAVSPVKLPDDTPLICCHACYRVQLANEMVCYVCGALMERAAPYLFPAKQLTKPYDGPLPKALAEGNINPSAASVPHTPQERLTTPPPSLGKTAPQALPNNDINPSATTQNPATGEQKICCHACYAVQSTERINCEKCGIVMNRAPHYFFVPTAKKK